MLTYFGGQEFTRDAVGVVCLTVLGLSSENDSVGGNLNA